MGYLLSLGRIMGGADSLDAIVGVYRIDVSGDKMTKWYWPHYINTIYVLKIGASKVKFDFLGFTCHIVMHHLKLDKLKKQIPTNIIYTRKRSWKDSAAVAGNDRTHDQHYLERCLQKRCRVCPKKLSSPICKVGFCFGPCFKAFHMDK